MTPITQDGRLLRLETPLGKDALLLLGFSGTEAISQLFDFQLNLVSERSVRKTVPLDALIGKAVTIHVGLAEGTRAIHGHVRRFGHNGADTRFDYYYAEVVPWLWFLTQTADCRVFQDKTVPEIVSQVCKEHGFLDLRLDLARSYTKWDYCVQYHETDFNFVSRVLEQEGIFYFFEHTASKHTLVLIDAPGKHPPCPGQPVAPFDPNVATGQRRDAVRGWQMEQAFRAGKYTLRDYHFETPAKTLQVGQAAKVNVVGNGKFEMYDYPGEYAQRFNKPTQRLGDVEPEGQQVVKVRMEELDGQFLLVRGSSTCRAFSAGSRFELSPAPPGVARGPWVLTAVEHLASQDSDFVSNFGVAGGYSNGFTCVPQSSPYRPTRVTPRPVIQGPQTAVVVGPKGEEIFTDKFGRVKVQFHWDREGKKDENSSCFVRVAQPVAGKRWGASFWPRIGQEVVVEFLEGDPEQPIIVGTVYNGEQMPPYLGDGLDPKHKNDNKLSGFKSNSTLGGKGYNELRFDDTAGKEQVFLHAQRNMDTRVLNDAMETVLANRHLTVGSEANGKKAGDQVEEVLQDKHLHVHRNQVEHVAGNMQLLIGGGEGDNGTLEVVLKKDRKERIEGDCHIQVRKARSEKVDGNQSLTVGGDQHEKVSMNHALEAGMAIHLKAGMTLVIEAGMQLSLKVGGNFIDINPAGVFIQGTTVMINSGGAAGSGAGAKPASPQDAREAAPKKPTLADESKSGLKSAP
jgi:type VI secretion system secreted protein VgrG